MDLGPWTAEDLAKLIELLPMMISSTICRGCLSWVVDGDDDANDETRTAWGRG